MKRKGGREIDADKKKEKTAMKRGNGDIEERDMYKGETINVCGEGMK